MYTERDYPTAPIERRDGFANNDLDDIDVSDVFVLFTETHHSRGGRHFELGYAYGTGISNLIVVGRQEHLFHYLAGVTLTTSWKQAKRKIIVLKEEEFKRPLDYVESLYKNWRNGD